MEAASFRVRVGRARPEPERYSEQPDGGCSKPTFYPKFPKPPTRPNKNPENFTQPLAPLSFNRIFAPILINFKHIVMYAIVEIAGQQFKVSKDLKVFVHRLDSKEGDAVSFAKVLLVDDNGTVTLGAPAVEGASVEAKVLQHLKGDKVIVFKKKRRKGYKKKNGHRQSLTQIQISGITVGGAAPKAKKAAAKKTEEPATEE